MDEIIPLGQGGDSFLCVIVWAGRRPPNKRGNTVWLFTQYGFFSVVCARDLTGKTKGIDPKTFMVRAGSRQHLESLQSRCAELRGFEIADTKNTDYRTSGK